MATYLLVNLAVLFVVLAVLFVFGMRFRLPSRAWWMSLVVLLVLTAVFDSMMVGVGFIGYNPDSILNISIGRAPIEDFFYPLVAMIIIPFIWNRMEKKA